MRMLPNGREYFWCHQLYQHLSDFDTRHIYVLRICRYIYIYIGAQLRILSIWCRELCFVHRFDKEWLCFRNVSSDLMFSNVKSSFLLKKWWKIDQNQSNGNVTDTSICNSNLEKNLRWNFEGVGIKAYIRLFEGCGPDFWWFELGNCKVFEFIDFTLEKPR